MRCVWPRSTALTIVAALTVAGCTAAVAEPPAPPGAEAPASSSVQPTAAASSAPSDPVSVLGGDAVELAFAASTLVWDISPTVVVAPADDELAIERGTGLARTLVAPLLLGPAAPSADGAATPTPTASPVDTSMADELAAELRRLGADTVVLAGDQPVVLPDGLEVRGSGDLPDPQAVDPSTFVALVAADAPATAARATLEAAGAQVVTLTGADPRQDPAAIRALASSAGDPVVGLGDSLGTLERLAPLVAVATTGVELPGGGQTLFPGRRLVALYGHPQTSALGVLGEQDPVASVERARQVAASYQPFSDEPVLPAFELIATVASGEAGTDGNYSNETPVQVLRPYVDAAAEAGVYVVLDLQPGRTDFVTQAKAYEELLVLPHVGLALDPEWRLAPDQVHLRQIGTVDASEITAVADWLAALVRDRALPQKLLLLHQFQQRMITSRQTLDAQRDELALLVQMDGDGTPGEKFDTWQALLADAPPGLLFGWKNFYDEDNPLLTPEQTLAVQPTPWWVSYQ